VDLVEALVAGDAGRVEHLMRAHLTHVRSIWAGEQQAER
jgi:DNA-binding FadR family transcriptional regulator